MKASEFTTEDNFGTHPKRPARTGSRHPRGHQPVPRYKTITAQDSDNTAESVAEGSESSIEKKIQAKQDSLSLAREQRRARGQRQQGQREIKLQAEIDKLNTELTQLKQQGVAEGLVTKIKELGMIGRVEYMGPDYKMPYRATLQDEKTGQVWHQDFNGGKEAEDWLANNLARYEQWKKGQQGVAEGSYDDDDTSMSEKLDELLQQGMDYKQAVKLVAKTYNTYPEYVVGSYNRWGNHNYEPYDNFGEQGVAEGSEEEKIGGRYDADEFDSMVARLKKLAGAGPMRTVYDPDRRVYRNMPTAQQPAQQPKKAPR